MELREAKFFGQCISALITPDRISELRKLCIESGLDPDAVKQIALAILQAFVAFNVADSDEWCRQNPGQPVPAEMLLIKMGHETFSATEIIEIVKDIQKALQQSAPQSNN